MKVAITLLFILCLISFCASFWIIDKAFGEIGVHKLPVVSCNFIPASFERGYSTRTGRKEVYHEPEYRLTVWCKDGLYEQIEVDNATFKSFKIGDQYEQPYRVGCLTGFEYWQ